jgi:phospholipid/cholesterol/gamma-HCH transport system substrate-binding protein
MKFSIRFADQVVGTLVILALAILVFVVFMLGKNQRWFVHDYQYKAYFSSASGISHNMPIQHKGFTIGHVKEISLAEDDSVEVVFTIFEEYIHRVREGSLVEVQVSPFGLGNAFNFYPGNGTELIPEGMAIPEINSREGRRLIAAGLAVRPESSDSISNIMNQAKTLLETLNVSLAGSEGAGDLTLGQIVSNIASTTAGLTSLARTLSEQLSPIMDNLEIISDQAADPSGTLMSVLDGEGPLYTNVMDAVDSLAGIIENLNKTSEFLPAQLPQIAVLIGELNAAARNLQDVLIAIANNPLLRGGMPEHRETGPGAASPRNLEF